jgi:hypothetical protein
LATTEGFLHDGPPSPPSFRATLALAKGLPIACFSPTPVLILVPEILVCTLRMGHACTCSFSYLDPQPPDKFCPEYFSLGEIAVSSIRFLIIDIKIQLGHYLQWVALRTGSEPFRKRNFLAQHSRLCSA